MDLYELSPGAIGKVYWYANIHRELAEKEIEKIRQESISNTLNATLTNMMYEPSKAINSLDGVIQRGLDDANLPKSRPEKYPWMIHAERNALSNCVVRPDNGIAYVTGQSCNDCIMALWQEGVTKVFMSDDHGTHLFDEEAQKRFDLFVQMSGIKIVKVKPNLSWLQNMNGV
jgi:deoxycytidylate deaminase